MPDGSSANCKRGWQPKRAQPLFPEQRREKSASGAEQEDVGQPPLPNPRRSCCPGIYRARCKKHVKPPDRPPQHPLEPAQGELLGGSAAPGGGAQPTDGEVSRRKPRCRPRWRTCSELRGGSGEETERVGRQLPPAGPSGCPPHPGPHHIPSPAASPRPPRLGAARQPLSGPPPRPRRGGIPSSGELPAPLRPAGGPGAAPGTAGAGRGAAAGPGRLPRAGGG